MVYSIVPGLVGILIDAITQTPTVIVIVFQVMLPLFGVLITTLRVYVIA